MAVKTKPSASINSKARSPASAPKKRSSTKKSNKPSFFQKLTSGKRKWVLIAVSLVLIGGVGTYMLRTSSAYSVSCREYSTADSGKSYSCVKYIQRILNSENLKYFDPSLSWVFYGGGQLEVDGYYGSKTKTVVWYFQKSTGALEVDGIVGPKTWSYLCYRAQLHRYNADYPKRADAYSAAVSAGCQGSGFPAPSTSAPVSTSSYENQITSCYGWRDGKLHSGVDIDGSNNRQPIYAVRSGKVVKVAYDSVLGLHVVVRHSSGDGYDSWYQHLSSETTYVGDTVSAGTKIGVQGESGSVSGSHLHFTLTKATSGSPDRNARVSSDISTASKIHMNYVKYTKLGGSNCGL